MGYRILIVDDSKIVRKSLTKTLELAQIPVSQLFEAENGKGALATLAATPGFDLVFLDINMPEMNGMEFMRCAKDSGSLGKAAVVVVSTEGSQIRTQELLDLGMKAQLRKPVRPEALAETVLSVLGGEKA